MPPQRKPLGSGSDGRFLGQHLSPYFRGRIAGKAEEGATPAKLANELQREYSTVFRTIQKDSERHEGRSLPRTSRKKSYSERDERVLLGHARPSPKDSYEQAIKACDLGRKRDTVRKILAEHGIANWKAKRRPFLTEEYAAKRLALCLERRHWTAKDWALVTLRFGIPERHLESQLLAIYDARAANYDNENNFYPLQQADYVKWATLQSGQKLLYLACGTGSILIPAAKLVGPTGKAVCVGISSASLNIARSKAEAVCGSDVHPS
ncbi:hypothetical protein BJ878DRAFT_567709 [Calycina marina]|uniref:Transposase Tc1-like domain-containing protein n=1 Tax=Calycina marina TaxID=1763456 RepID=A0A9P7Z3L8_9HELO|nr:hypothetical protein BJ878DRAFT_567709 [Calycina marina]